MPNKALGQHWLKDRVILEAIADAAELSPSDTVLEIGPGLGTLTSALLRRAGRVVAVEYDELLAAKLPGQFPGTSLEVINADILQFDTTALPAGYKVVANVPYYITAKIIERLVLGEHMPEICVILIQQEVAEKYAATPGSLSELAVLLQTFYGVQLGIRVPKMYFTPPPKVDSQVLICKKRHVAKIAQNNIYAFRRLVHAGFAAPRKKVRSSLAAGFHVDPATIDTRLVIAGIDPDARAQDLSIDDWTKLL